MNQAPRVVVAEDEPSDLIFITKAFERGALDTQVTACESGAAVITHLEECAAAGELPDLLLLDLNLPLMPGLEVLEAIRANEVFAPLIVIVFTSSAYRREIDAAYRAGANAYVTKPARLAELDGLVQSIEDFWFRSAQRPFG